MSPHGRDSAGCYNTSMAVPGRTIAGITPDTLVEELAEAAIEQRLEVVAECFSQSAQGEIDDCERIHQLRVSTRRAAASLQLFKKFCPRRQAKRLLKQLKRIRRAAGTARDIDVFADRLAKLAEQAHRLLAPVLASERHQAQKKLSRLFDDLSQENRFVEQIESVSEFIKPRGKQAKRDRDKTLQRWAPKRLRKAIERMLDQVPDSLDRPLLLHPLRIEGKRVRYTLELLAAGLPTATYDLLYPLFETLQDRLGAINDHQAAVDRLVRNAVAEDDTIDEVVQRERLAMERAIAELRPWFDEVFLPPLKAPVTPKPDSPEAGGPAAASA